MIGFKLSQDGDIVVERGQIQMVADGELKRQTVQSVIGTNKGEWFLNEDEGINNKSILTKNPDAYEVRGEILGALQQVDKNLTIENFEYKVNKDRSLKVNFEANDVNSSSKYKVEKTIGTQ